MGQRIQYGKGGVGRRYWDYRDRISLSHVLGPRILDAGCGEGVTLQKLIQCLPEARVQGIDIDLRNIDICREHKLPVPQASLYDLPFPNRSFDTCLLMEVIEHLHKPDKALRELARIIKPTGRIVVVYPVDRAMWLGRIVCLRFREARFNPGHVRQWSRWDLARLMRECGFRPVSFRSLPLPSPFMLHGLMVAERQS